MSEFKSGIYKITNTANGKIYLGQAVDIDKRLKRHKSELKNNKHNNQHLQAAYNQCGASAFTFEPILYCDESLLNEYEIDLIYLSESYKPEIGYNKTLGGEGGRPTEETKAKISKANLGKVLTEEHRANISAAQKGKVLTEEQKAKLYAANKGKKRKPHTEETKAKISKANLGNKNFLGHHHTEETKDKLSKVSLGRTHTEESKAKISKANLGKTFSEETKDKLSKAKLGKTHTEESKALMSAAHMGMVNNAKLTEENVIDILKTCNDSKSMKNASIKYNVSYHTIYDVVKKITWKHINIESVA